MMVVMAAAVPLRLLLLRNQILRKRAYSIKPRLVRGRKKPLKSGEDVFPELRLAYGRETSVRSKRLE